MTIRKRHAPTVARRRTYSHLAALRKIPDDYDVATTKLLYYPGRGFAVNATASDWYARHQAGSCLASVDWEGFVDPRRTTYSKYVALERAREAQADGIVQALLLPGYDERLPAQWQGVLRQLIGPLRFPLHGLSMVASYIGSMAPAGRVVIAALFQSADEMRRIQRLTQRLAQLSRLDPRFVEEAKPTWQNAPEWQPLRAVVERLLVAYDWAEAFVALNACVKPVVDRLVTDGIGAEALASGDPLLGALLRNLGEDAEWHRAYTRSFLEHAVAQNDGSRAVITRIVHQWMPRAMEAAVPLSFALGGSAKDVLGRVHDAARRDVAPFMESAP